MNLFKRKQKVSGSYAPVETNLLVKSDRINSRIQKLGETVRARNPKGTITNEELVETIKAIQMIISQELNIRGKEEWKWDYISKQKKSTH